MPSPSAPIPLKDLWEHLKNVKYGSKSRAEKRCFGSDAEQGSHTKVTFDSAFKRHAFKESIDYNLAGEMKKIKISTTPDDCLNAFFGARTPRCSAGNDENNASLSNALYGNGSSSGTSDSAEL